MARRMPAAATRAEIADDAGGVECHSPDPYGEPCLVVMIVTVVPLAGRFLPCRA